MAKMLRDVYVPAKNGGTELLNKGEDCPKELEKAMVEKGYAEAAKKPEPKK